MNADTTSDEPMLVRDGALRETDGGWTLVGSLCRASGHVGFPPSSTCPESLSEEVEPIDLPRTGTLFAHTTVHMRTAHFKPPYQVGYVDLDEAGPRVFAPLEGEDLKIGERMRLAVETMWEEGGRPVIAYRFVREKSDA